MHHCLEDGYSYLLLAATSHMEDPTRCARRVLSLMSTDLDVFQISSTMEDLRVFSYVLISILYGISATTILMRVYVRGLTMRSFWWDDWLMTAMMVSLSGCEVGMSPAAPGPNTCAVF